jgi:hypothetical protein
MNDTATDIIANLLNPKREPEAEPRWLNTAEAVAFTGLTRSYFVSTRQNGTGPPFIELAAAFSVNVVISYSS